MLIEKDDAIQAICEVCYMYKYIGEHYRDCKYYPCDDIKALEAIPSADAEQVTGKLKNPCDSLLTEESDGSKEQKSKLDLISRELAMERIANDNVSGGLERIHEYNNSTEFNDYLDGISDAITTVFCDVPSADITETETCQKCQDVTDTILNRQGERIKELEESAEAVQGWIPVEEQPPQFPCLVCDANWNQPSVPLGIVTITDEEHGEWHIDGRLWDTKIFFKGEWCSQTGYGNRIIAWMPLPDPYKGGDTDDV